MLSNHCCSRSRTLSGNTNCLVINSSDVKFYLLRMTTVQRIYYFITIVYSRFQIDSCVIIPQTSEKLRRIMLYFFSTENALNKANIPVVFRKYSIFKKEILRKFIKVV